jgi:hypothetical protein
MAGARFSASGNNTLTSTPGDTALTVHAATASLRRAYVYELIMGNEGVPADNVLNWTVQRITDPNTANATQVVATRMDLADAEADTLAYENHTAEPTYTSTEELLEFPLNTRATFRWVAAPGSEIVIPATNLAGIGINSFHASAVTDYRGTALWLE